MGFQYVRVAIMIAREGHSKSVMFKTIEAALADIQIIG
jgi:hypothetical protein